MLARQTEGAQLATLSDKGKQAAPITERTPGGDRKGSLEGSAAIRSFSLRLADEKQQTSTFNLPLSCLASVLTSRRRDGSCTWAD